MDILVSDDSASDSDARDGERASKRGGEELPQDDFAVFLPRFTGACVGDAMYKASQKATRLVALQAGGTGSNGEHWGHFWGQGLRDVGGLIGAVTETRMFSESAQAAACRGLQAAGFVAICHGVGPGKKGCSDGEELVLLANGVILAVRDVYAGGWERVERDKDGRGLAANVMTKGGDVLRVMALYGVAGASLPGFERDKCRVEAEKRVLQFAAKQRDMAVQHGWLLVAIGDVNSVCRYIPISPPQTQGLHLLCGRFGGHGQPLGRSLVVGSHGTGG